MMPTISLSTLAHPSFRHQRRHQIRPEDMGEHTSLGVGARRLDVAGLLALVADLLTASVLLGAVAAEVAVLTAVVALGAVGAVTCGRG